MRPDLPQNIVAEQNVLGALMLVPESLSSVASFLQENDFFQERHQLIYRAICELNTENEPFDPVTASEWFQSNGLSNLVGGSKYILELANDTASAANVVAYAEIVREKAVMRRIIEIGAELQAQAMDPKGRSRELSARTATTLLELAGGAAANSSRSATDVLKSWYAKFVERFDRKGYSGIPTPWSRFNDLTDGLQDTDLVILAGRPSMGKSAVAMNLALCAAGQGKPVHVFSLEMSSESLIQMSVAILNERADRSYLRRPDSKNESALPAMTEAFTAINGMPMTFDDAGGLTIDQIVLRAKREHMRRPLRLVVIDHLHLIPLPGKTKESTEIGDVTAKCKRLAKSLRCPVLLLSQLNRGVESRANKRPNMGDLRESGAIEQDADVIVFVYRDDYYAQKDGRGSEYPGYIELDVAKQREGGTGRVFCSFNGRHGRVENVDVEPMPIVRKETSTTYARKPKG